MSVSRKNIRTLIMAIVGAMAGIGSAYIMRLWGSS